MKLSELGLKTKPATKYFDGGFIKFSTVDKELHFAVMIWTVDRRVLCLSHQGWIQSNIILDKMLNIKTFDEVRKLIPENWI